MIKSKKKLALSIPQIIKNNMYALKLMLKIYPLKFSIKVFFWITINFLNFFSHDYMIRYVVNGLQEGKKITLILSYVFFMLLLNIVLTSLQDIYNCLALPIIDCKCNQKLNLGIYRRSLELDLENYENPEAYDLYNRAVTSGVGSIQKVMDSIGTIFSIVIGLSLDGWLLYEIDPWLFVFVVIPWLFSPLDILSTKVWRDENVALNKIGRRKDYTLRTFFLAEYAKEMRLTNMHRVMVRKFRDSIKDFLELVRTTRLRASAISSLYWFGTQVLTSRVAQIYAIYRTLISGTIMYGDCLVVMNLVSDLSYTAAETTEVFSNLYAIAMEIQDYRIFMEMQPKVSLNLQGKNPQLGDIVCKNLFFRYAGAEKDTLKDINLEIAQGERVAIVGHNGAGKTTLVKLLMRLYDPSGGAVYVGGEDIREYKLKEYRSTFGVVFQDYKQLALSVAENVLGRPYTDSDEATVRNALEKAGIADAVAQLPQGIHTAVTKEFSEDGFVPSGGQSQKLAIATIYARDVHTVILDEPSSALDPIAEHQLYENMIEASAGKTVIFISHRLSSCVDADRIIYMENGTIAEMGTHRELMKADGKYAEMFRVQAQNYTDQVCVGGEHHA